MPIGTVRLLDAVNHAERRLDGASGQERHQRCNIFPGGKFLSGEDIPGSRGDAIFIEAGHAPFLTDMQTVSPNVCFGRGPRKTGRAERISRTQTPENLRRLFRSARAAQSVMS
jgi:hypothetical protein